MYVVEIGMRVETNMGVRRVGTIVKHIGLHECTDGTYRGPHTEREIREWVSVKWDDGTQGYINRIHLTRIEQEDKR